MSEFDKEVEVQEVETVKNQLDLLNIKYHHNASLKTLKGLLKDANEEAQKKEESTGTGKVTPAKRAQIREDILKPVRCKVVCLNPMKKSWRGEYFGFGNSVVGMCRDFIPYNCAQAEDIWIPQMLVNILKARKYLYTTPLDERQRQGSEVAHRTDWLPEFSIEILEQPK
ncbi:MAG: hypothetical protein ACRCR2_02295 [Fusobacteriaceae bacterium]